MRPNHNIILTFLFITGVLLIGCTNKDLSDETTAECKNTQNQQEKDNCYFKIAEKNKDISICDKISSKGGSSECYYEILVSMEGKNISISLCDDLKDGWGKYYCYSKVAIAEQDISVCNLIPNVDDDNTIREASLESIYLPPPYLRATCLMEVAKLKRDIKICEMIEIEHFKDNCLTNIAIINQDVQILL
ncbi:MAG: hypothetical protein AABX33_07125 [Nanoarchaeota archaeon]